jgi:hypothetical protein
MNIQEYTAKAALTFKHRDIGIDPRTTDLLHCAIGIVTEAGELCLAINIDGVPDKINLLEEIGDVQWYQYNLARLTNWEPINLKEQVLPAEDIYRAISLLVVCASELMDHFKRGIYYLKGIEIDDINHLLMSICNYFNIDFEKCMDANIAKLAKRYPDLIFTPEAALNRDTNAERKELEK